MRIFPLAARDEDPWFRLLVIPSPYVSWDRKERVLAFGLELWGAYAEICFDLSGED